MFVESLPRHFFLQFIEGAGQLILHTDIHSIRSAAVVLQRDHAFRHQHVADEVEVFGFDFRGGFVVGARGHEALGLVLQQRNVGGTAVDQQLIALIHHYVHHVPFLDLDVLVVLLDGRRQTTGNTVVNIHRSRHQEETQQQECYVSLRTRIDFRSFSGHDETILLFNCLVDNREQD